MSMKTNYTTEGLTFLDQGLRVWVKRETGGVPRFEHLVVPWCYVLQRDIVREIVLRHTRSMEAPPPWNEGDVSDPLC
uniref:Uncharacterized protein n=1 Tax=uncultured prokaryote TaxID=198431 RepID=A0A0H5Q5P2_9ZZZZ|nr:hypothetical protein [uncultured prokaryote]